LQQLTLPHKKSKKIVPETDGECDPEEQSEEEELITPTLRRRFYQTQWQHVVAIGNNGNLNKRARTGFNRQKSIGKSMRLWSSH
jgi:hypothetical protein